MEDEHWNEPKTVIIESDAGLVKERKIQQENKEKMLEELRIERAKYAHLRRNDLCSCGSGKKFKNCHLSIF